MQNCKKCENQVEWRTKKSGNGGYFVNPDGSFHGIKEGDDWVCSVDGKTKFVKSTPNPGVSISIERILLSLLEEQKKTNEFLVALLDAKPNGG